MKITILNDYKNDVMEFKRGETLIIKGMWAPEGEKHFTHCELKDRKEKSMGIIPKTHFDIGQFDVNEVKPFVVDKTAKKKWK